MNCPIRLTTCAALLIVLAACATPPPTVEPPPGARSPQAVMTAPAAPPAAPAATPAAPDPKLLGIWRIEQARSAPLLDKRVARLDFGTDGQLSGQASCNGFTASYSLVGDRLKIGRIVTTRKACSVALMEQEDRVLTALERASRATVPSHGFLTLQDDDGAVLMRGSRLDEPR